MEEQATLPATYVEGFHDLESVKKLPYRPLGQTGMKVAIVGLGSSALGGSYTDKPESDVEKSGVIVAGLRAGMNFIDSAPWYGHGKSETLLGKAFQQVPRSSYYLATKVGRYLPQTELMFDFSYERTLKSVDESLARMGLDYIDLIQVHDMEFAPSPEIIVNETLPALQKVKEEGKVKFIGITGYPLSNFKTILELVDQRNNEIEAQEGDEESKRKKMIVIDTVLSYCHYSLNDTSLADWIPYFQQKGLGIINAAPISMGLLCLAGPPIWHPASAKVKEVCKEANLYCQSQGVDLARLAMHFSLQNTDIATVLVSTPSKEAMLDNVKSASYILTEKEAATLDYVRQTYFNPLNNENWEGAEVAKYRRKLAEVLKQREEEGGNK